MAANPASGAEYFTVPRHPNQRRYEALRAYFTEGLSVTEAGARAGYTRAADTTSVSGRFLRVLMHFYLR